MDESWKEGLTEDEIIQCEINEQHYEYFRETLGMDIAHEIDAPEWDNKRWFQIMTGMDFRKKPWRLPASCLELNCEMAHGFVWNVTKGGLDRIEKVTPGWVTIGEPMMRGYCEVW